MCKKGKGNFCDLVSVYNHHPAEKKLSASNYISTKIDMVCMNNKEYSSTIPPLVTFPTYNLGTYYYYLVLKFVKLPAFWEWVTGGGPALTFTQVPDSLVVKCRVAAY